MSELSKYSLYVLCNGQTTIEDPVDSLLSKVDRFLDYASVANFVSTNFGEFDGEKSFEYPKTNKRIWIRRLENEIHVFGEANKSFFYSKGWRNRKALPYSE